MDLRELEKQYEGTTLAKLIEHMIRKMSERQLLTAIQDTYLQFPESLREAVDQYTLQFPQDWWLNKYMTERDLSVIFNDAVRENRRFADSHGVRFTDNQLFHLFNLGAMRVAHFAHSRKDFRKSFGIRKGLFG